MNGGGGGGQERRSVGGTSARRRELRAAVYSQGLPFAPRAWARGEEEGGGGKLLSSLWACGPLLLVRISPVGALYRIRRESRRPARLERAEWSRRKGGEEGVGEWENESSRGLLWMVTAMVMTPTREQWREREGGRASERSAGVGGRHRRRGGRRTASSKVGKKPRKGLCLMRGPAGGRKLRVFVCPPIRSRDRWSFSYPPIHPQYVPGKRGRLALEQRE